MLNYHYVPFSFISFDFCVLDNNMLWSADNAAAVSGDSELTGTDRLKLDALAHPESSLGRDAHTFSDGRTQDTITVLLPSLPNLSAHPHKGKV